MSRRGSFGDSDLAAPDLTLNRQRNRHLVEEILGQARDAGHERLLGCMLGLAVGDVLGCPVEGMSFRDIQDRYGTVDGLLFPKYWRRWRLPGLHSDDTQQALAVLEAVRRAKAASGTKGGLSFDTARELASIYVDGMQANQRAPFGCWRGTGRRFRSVVERLSQDRQAEQWPYGYGEPSAGLGAVMRIPPAGLIGGNFSAIAELVSHITDITHTDPGATVSACAIAFACHLLSGEKANSFQPERFLSQLFQQVRCLEQRPPAVPGARGDPHRTGEPVALTSKLISLVGELVGAAPGTAMRQIAQLTQQITGQRVGPTGGFAPSGIAAGLYFFVHDAWDPRKALLSAINAGGDTDTIGAVVGALCGTLHGASAYREFLPDIVALYLIVGKALAVADPMAGDPFDLIEEENLLTEIEEGIKARLRRLSEREPR